MNLCIYAPATAIYCLYVCVDVYAAFQANKVVYIIQVKNATTTKIGATITSSGRQTACDCVRVL